MWPTLGWLGWWWLGHWPSRLVRAWLGRLVCATVGLGWRRLVRTALGLGLPTVGLAIRLLRAGVFVWLAGDLRHNVVSIL